LQVENEYKIHVVEPRAQSLDSFPEHVRETMIVKFEDHSQDGVGEVASSSRKRDREAMGIELPRAEFFRIHAAIAGVLHMSGAGRFFDELLAKFNDYEDGPVVPSDDGVSKAVNDFERLDLMKGESEGSIII
jgi:hypothetical protein